MPPPPFPPGQKIYKPAFGSLTIFVEPNYGLASGSFSKIQEPFMNLELQAYAKWSRSNSTTAPVCLHQNLFYYNCIDQNSRFMEIGYRQKGKGYIGYMCFSWPSKNIWRDRSRYSLRQGGKQMVYSKQLWSANSDLSDRTQFVSCCGCGSSKREITYGVSQGSVLGPTPCQRSHKWNNRCLSILLCCFMYADHTEVHTSSKDIDRAEEYINCDLKSTSG